MPRVVDHTARQQEIVRAVRRVLAREGSSGMTMRQVAAEAGYANGALKPYFASKADLIEATYTHVFERTNERVTRAVVGRSGLAALEMFCREVMPLDADRLDEARVVMTFWQEATHDPVRAEHNRRFMAQWRESVTGWLTEARGAGELAEDVDLTLWGDTLLTFLLGTQVTAALGLPIASPDLLEAQLQGVLAPVRARGPEHAGAPSPLA